MRRIDYIPAYLKGSTRETYQLQRLGDTFMLYTIDRNVRNHNLTWTGRINLSDLITWDERFVNITKPESERKMPNHTRQCFATLELVTQKGIEIYHLDFDNDEYELVHSLARTNLRCAEINHVPFDLSTNDADKENSVISVGMHSYAPFPQEIFEFYRQTRLTDTTILRSDQQHILDRIAKLVQPSRN